MKQKLAILLFLGAFAACKKDNKGTPTPVSTGITEKELTEVSSTIQRNWFLVEQNEVYINNAGGTDSTITKTGSGVGDSDIQFSISATNGQRVFALYDDGKLKRLLQGIGNWSLTNNGTTINFITIPMWPEGGKGGIYSLKYDNNTPLPFPYPKSILLKQTENLSGGRKVEKEILLGSN